jgi:hypothetical protein
MPTSTDGECSRTFRFPSCSITSGLTTGPAGLDTEADELFDAANRPMLAGSHGLHLAHQPAMSQLFVDET